MNACLTNEELVALSLGELAEERLEQVTDHLEACTSCADAARTLDAQSDAFMQSLRAAGAGRSAGATAAPAADPPEAAPPRRVGGYDLLGELGRGGMGVVYRARDRNLGRVVALKLLAGGAFADPARRERFRWEAEAVARLRHPGIVQIYHVGEHETPDGGRYPYFVLELVEGGSLGDRLAGPPPAPREAAALVEQVARAAHHAHEHGIVHRDIKPSNILLNPDGRVMLCDFGVAKALGGGGARTETGLVVGTPEYMAPEQLGAAARITPQVDVYALGVVLYSLLAGRPPFRASSAAETFALIGGGEPVPPRRWQPSVPADLEVICLKCLQKDPGRRYARALDLAEDLRRFLAGKPILARPTPAGERAVKWARRQPSLAALLALALFVVTVGFPAVTVLWLRAESAGAEARAERGRAESERGRAETALYFNRLTLADRELSANEVTSALSLLELSRPADGRPDLRGWEWYYLHRLCHAELRSDLAHKHWVLDSAYAPDGKTVYTAAGPPTNMRLEALLDPAKTPGELKAWDVDKGRLCHEIPGHPGALWTVAVSPDGKWLASGDGAGEVRLHETATLRLAATLPRVGGGVRRVRFSPDGRTLAVAGKETVILWDVAGKRERKRLPAKGGSDVLAFSPSGRLAAAAVSQGEGSPAALSLWDSADGSPVSHRVPPGPIRALDYSPDGRFLALARPYVHRVHLWNAAGTELVRELAEQGGPILALAFAPDGRLATAGEDRAVRLWDPDSGACLATYRGHTRNVRTLAFRGDGRRLVSAGENHEARVWDTSRRPEGFKLRPLRGPTPGGESVGNFAFTADGRDLLVVQTVKENAAVGVWDVASGTEKALRPVRITEGPAFPRADIALTADGSRVAALRADDVRVVAVWRTGDGAELLSLSRHGRTVSAVALTPDGGLLATAAGLAGGDKSAAEVVVWDGHTGREVLRLPVRALRVDSVALSPDGRRLAAACRVPAPKPVEPGFPLPAVLHVWDVADGRELHRLDDHQGLTICVAFNPDGTRLAFAASQEDAVCVWDLSTGKLRFPPLASNQPTGVAFSPDGRRLASNGYDGLVRLWDADTGTTVITLRGFGPPAGGQYGFTGRVVFSPDGTLLAANNWDATVSVWEAEAAGR